MKKPIGNQSARRRAWARDPQRRKATSRRFRKLWRDPEYRRLRVAAAIRQWSDPDRRRRVSEALRKAWRRNPARRKRTASMMRRQWRDPAYRRLRTEGMQGRWRDAAVRQRMSTARQLLWKNPHFKKRMSKALSRAWRKCSPQRRAHRIAIAKRSLGPSLGARRLHSVLGGRWILEYWTPHGPIDIADPHRRVGIEVDGGDHDRPQRRRQDVEKERALKALGWRIYRVSEDDCRAIRRKENPQCELLIPCLPKR